MTSIIVGMKYMLSNFAAIHRTIYWIEILRCSFNRYSTAQFLCNASGNIEGIFRSPSLCRIGARAG